jgi:hypothetical protein
MALVMSEDGVFTGIDLQIEAKDLSEDMVDTQTVSLSPKPQRTLKQTYLSLRREMEKEWDVPQDSLSWKQLFAVTNREWRFDASSRLSFLEMSQFNRSVVRNESKGINPLQLCSRPFTRLRNTIHFQIVKTGSWIRLGIVDRNVKVNNGDLIGDQEDCFNVGYCRSGSLSKHGATFDTIADLPTRLETGNVVSIVYEPDKSGFSFFVNRVLKKVIRVRDYDLEGKIFPCVQISWHCRIDIVDGNFMEIDGE